MYFLDAALIYDGVHLLAAALGQLSNVQELQVRLYRAQKTVFYVTRNLRPPPHEALILYHTIDHMAAVLGPLFCPSGTALPLNCLELIQPRIFAYNYKFLVYLSNRYTIKTLPYKNATL